MYVFFFGLIKKDLKKGKKKEKTKGELDINDSFAGKVEHF